MGSVNLLALTAIVAAPWLHYGANLEGHRHADEVPLTPSRAKHLGPGWTFRTGDATDGKGYFGRASSFKATPVLVDRALIFSTGFNRVYAIDAKTGRQRWRFDPKVDFGRPYAEMFTSRGIAVWRDPTSAASGRPVPLCRTRIFLGTLDARLFAIDARTGRLCAGFGVQGAIDLSKGVKNFRRGEYSVTSPPLVVNDVVIVGASVGDNGGAELESGIVRAFDARTGAQRWSFDPTPPGAGGANVWTAMSADVERGLVFLPTTSPSPDFFGGQRPRDKGHANSLVALNAKTGRLVWSYRIVRHDLWDYDLASQPLLLDWPRADGARPAVAVATKMGFVFVLDRQTGEPLVEVEERWVPPSTIHDEHASPKQRFSKIQLHPVAPPLPGLLDAGPEHENVCRRMLKGVRYEGIFTPPSLEGTLLYPGNPGGTNWGSMTLDAKRGLMLLAVNRLPTVVKLIPRARFREQARRGTFNGVRAQFTAQSGTPYGMARYELYNRANNLPCLKGPYAQLFAVELGTGKVKWRAPAGVAPGAPKGSPLAEWGTIALGGPMTTAGGLTFLGTPLDAALRAYDTHTGDMVWSAPLPAGAHGTPMSYRLDDRMYVVVAAGGDLREGEGRGDFLVAFTAPVDAD